MVKAQKGLVQFSIKARLYWTSPRYDCRQTFKLSMYVKQLLYETPNKIFFLRLANVFLLI